MSRNKHSSRGLMRLENNLLADSKQQAWPGW